MCMCMCMCSCCTVGLIIDKAEVHTVQMQELGSSEVLVFRSAAYRYSESRDKSVG